MISGIMAKVAAFFAALSGGFFLFIKYQSSKINGLEDDNETLQKKAELKSKSEIDKARIFAKEADEVLAMTKEVNKSEKITLNDINDL